MEYLCDDHRRDHPAPRSPRHTSIRRRSSARSRRSSGPACSTPPGSRRPSRQAAAGPRSTAWCSSSHASARAPRRSRQRAVGPDDPVARDDDRDRVATVRQPDGPDQLRVAQPAGELRVGDGLAVGDARRARPRRASGSRVPCECERQLEVVALAGEVGVELLACWRRRGRRCPRHRRGAGTARSAAPRRRRAGGCRRPGWDGSSCTCLLQRCVRAGCDQP